MSRANLAHISAAVAVVLVLGACAAAGSTRTITLRTLNDSGVSGTVTLTELDSSRTRVTVSVDPAGHPDMPAHIHPGTCDDLVPQPQYALANVVDGRSTTEVPASFDELLAAGVVAVNLHLSNDQMEVYTACAVLE